MTKEHKERLRKRKIAYIYLLHRMFEGNYAMMLKVLEPKDIRLEDLQDWDMDYKDAVYQTIQEEDTKGVRLKDPTPVPSIKSIKEKLLRRCDALINSTEDPARLAQVYKILSEFENVDEKKEKSVLDAINESVKPLTAKQKESMTMLEKMRSEGLAPEHGQLKRKPGRPRKVIPGEAAIIALSQKVNNVEQEEPTEEE